MDDIFSKIISIIILVITLCIIPAFYLNIYYDFVSYNNKLNEAYLFLDNATLKGEILEDKRLLDSNFQLIVLRNRYFPKEDDVCNIAYTNASILDEIVSKKSFKLNVGDIVVITWDNEFKNSNLFLNNIFNFKFSNIPIRIAGVVRNECL